MLKKTNAKILSKNIQPALGTTALIFQMDPHSQLLQGALT